MGLFKLIASGGNPVAYAALSIAESAASKRKAPTTQSGSGGGPGPSPLMGIGILAGGMAFAFGVPALATAIVGAIGITATVAAGAGLVALAGAGYALHRHHNDPLRVLQRDIARTTEQLDNNNSPFLAEKLREKLDAQRQTLDGLTARRNFNDVSPRGGDTSAALGQTMARAAKAAVNPRDFG
jgi:hypothetical protein